MKTRTNLQAHQLAQEVFPGGVNSPVRAFKRVGGPPLTFVQGQGPWLRDVEGRKYLDFNLAWGSLILGHAPRCLQKPLSQRLRRGTSFGAPTVEELNLGRWIQDRVPSLERLRFVSTGTEAVMSALRVARAATGRSLVVKFDGGYHGHSDALLVAAGSGAAEMTQPDSAGIPEDQARSTISLPYNDLGSVEEFFLRRGREVAAVIVEPLAGNMGFVKPLPGFLEGLRRLTQDHGALLILDEVITGFRVHPQGAQGLLQIKPDLTTLGKIIGGGFPAAAFGGRKELMELVAPRGSVYQAGTLSGNPMAMEAGYQTLRELEKPGVREALDRDAEEFVQELEGILKPLSGTVPRQGSMFGIFFRAQGAPQNWEEVLQADPDRFAHFFHQALAAGLYFSPSPFEAHFLSTAHKPSQWRRGLKHLEENLRRVP